MKTELFLNEKQIVVPEANKLIKMESVHKELDNLLSDIETVVAPPSPATANLGFSLTNRYNKKFPGNLYKA
jgi:hypothetical protein